MSTNPAWLLLCGIAQNTKSKSSGLESQSSHFSFQSLLISVFALVVRPTINKLGNLSIDNSFYASKNYDNT